MSKSIEIDLYSGTLYGKVATLLKTVLLLTYADALEPNIIMLSVRLKLTVIVLAPTDWLVVFLLTISVIFGQRLSGYVPVVLAYL